jgi:chromate transporter
MTENKPSLTKLFLVFLKIGATAFGGPAMLPHVRGQIVDKRKWLDPTSFDNGIALCQAIPGAIIMQVAAYAGLKIRGIRGAIVSFVGFGLPAFLLMFILSVLYKEFKDVSVIQSIMKVMHIIIASMIAHAAFTFGKRTLRGLNDFIIALLAAVLFLTKLHPALVVLVAAIAGIVLSRSMDINQQDEVKANTFRFFLALLTAVIASLLIIFFISKKYFILATAMLRIDLFSFGGGFAAVPVMLHEVIGIFNWMDKQTFLDGIVLGQITPGSIIITATFIGYIKYGIAGSLIATIYVFTPSFLILIGLVPFFDRLKKYPQFNRAVRGVLCSFVGLLLIVVWHIGVDISWNIYNVAFAIIVFLVLLLKVDVVWVILGGIGISFFIH